MIAAAEPDFVWEDQSYLAERAQRYGKFAGERPINLYELNLASFAADADYRKLAETLPV